jgi:hypothetical protein
VDFTIEFGDKYDMSKNTVTLALVSACTFLFAALASAQESTPPASAADKEAAYTVMIEKRTAEILAALALDNPAKVATIHDMVTNQYRALRSRDEAIDAKLKAMDKETAGKAATRDNLFQSLSKPLHQQFIAKLSENLTPEQVELVKDRMTYGKVKFTYDGYCQIVPGLTDTDKAKVMEMLKQAREEAIDGGSAKEKTDIFQKHKDKINAYLKAQGHDVDKALKEWNAKQDTPKKQMADATTPSPQPAK